MRLALPYEKRGNWHQIILICLGTALYWLSGRLGLVFASLNSNASPVWIASAVSVAAILNFGYCGLAITFLGSLLLNLSIPTPLLPSLGIAAGNTLEGLAAALLIQFFFKSRDSGHPLLRVPGLSVAAILSSILGATVGSVSLLMSSLITSSHWSEVFSTWAVGDALGILVILPLYLHAPWIRKQPLARSRHALWTLPLIIVYAVVLWALPSARFELILASFFLVYFLHYMWSPWIPSLFVALCATLIIGTTLQGHALYHLQSKNLELISSQLFIGTLACFSNTIAEFKRHRLFRRVPATVMVIGLLIATLSFKYEVQEISKNEAARFQNLVRDRMSHLSYTVMIYENSLQSAVGYVQSSRLVERSEWKEFEKKSRITERFPGVLGMGLIYPFSPSDKVRHLDGSPLPTGRDLPGTLIPDYEKSQLPRYIITDIAPLDTNGTALGRDIGSEATRRAAADRARLSGRPALTAPLILVQRNRSGPGFLFMLPFERTQFRREGWVYFPLLAEDFFRHALRLENNLEPEFYVDVRPASFGDGSVFRNRIREATSPKLEASTRFVWGQQDFLLTWSRSPYFKTVTDLDASIIFLAIVFFALLLVTQIISLQTEQIRAQHLVSAKTRQLSQLHRRLNDSHQHLERVLQGIGLGCWTWNFTERTFQFDDRAVMLLDLSSGEKVSADMFFARIHEEDATKVREYFFRQSPLSSDEQEVVLRYVFAEKKQKWLLLRSTASCSDRRQHSVPEGTLLDVTQLKEAELALQEKTLSDLHQYRLAALGQMAAGIAHEINSPLATIALQSERLFLRTEDFQNPSSRKVFRNGLTLINKTVERINNIVRSLRIFAKDDDRTPRQLTEVNRILHDTAPFCQERFKTRGIPLDFEESQNSPQVLCHSVQISQIIINLLNNAFDAIVEAGTESPRVRVYSRMTSDRVDIVVEDNGPGIPPELQKKIMAPFFSTKAPGSGTGLGLSVSKTIAESHGGHLWMESAPGLTQFVISLPIGQAVSQDDNVRKAS